MSSFYTQTNTLYHAGVPRRSGRYPWGSGKRPYQSGGGPSGSSKSGTKKPLTEEEKQRVLKEGKASEVLRLQSEFTTKELSDAVERIRLNSKLSEYSQKELKSFMDKMDDAMQSIQTTTNWLKIATDTYNTLAKIYNTTEKGKKKPLTLVAG